MDKDLKRMSRSELVEIIYQYQIREKELLKENEELKEVLADRRIRIDNAGSIAEAALSLSGIFEAAQDAADQYLTELRIASSEADQMAQQLVIEAQNEANRIRKETARECLEMKTRTEAACSQMRQKIAELLDSQENLKSLLQSGGMQEQGQQVEQEQQE